MKPGPATDSSNPTSDSVFFLIGAPGLRSGGNQKTNFQKHPANPSYPTPAHAQQGFQGTELRQVASEQHLERWDMVDPACKS